MRATVNMGDVKAAQRTAASVSPNFGTQTLTDKHQLFAIRPCLLLRMRMWMRMPVLEGYASGRGLETR